MRDPDALQARHPSTVLGERLREAERALIATALYVPQAAADLVGALPAEHLRSERLRALWGAMERLLRDGRAATELELIAAGLDMALLEDVRGLEFDVAGAPSIVPALKVWRAAHAASRGFQVLEAAQSALARAEFFSTAVLEATSGLAAALAAINRDMATERAATTLLDAVAEYVRSTRAGESRQVIGSWGLPVLDERLGCIRAGTMHVCCAFPGHGKSTLGLEVARATAARGRRVLYVTTEMLRHELAMRVLCAESNCSPSGLEWRIKHDHGDVHGHEVAALIVPEDRQRDIDAIAASVRTARQRDERFHVVVLDYLQMLQGPGETEYERLSYIAYRIKQLALDEDVGCVVMAQVNRTADVKGPPSMRALRGSSAIEDAADSIVSMFRLDRTDPTGSEYEMLVRIEKARNGQPGDVATGPQCPERIVMGAGTFSLRQPNRPPDEVREVIP